MSNRILPFLILAATLVLGGASKAQAQTRDQLFIGARPRAMGETFVAIADDGTAIYWNPAGLPFLRKYEVNFAYANLFGLGLQNTYLSLFAPVAKRFVLGADWLRLGYDDVENNLGLEFSQNMFNFSLASRLLENLSVGANFKYVNIYGSEDQLSFGKADGVGLDLGVLLSPGDWIGAPFDKLRLGVMAHDLTGTKVTFDNGASDTIQRRNLRYGIAYSALDNLMVGVDVDDRVHLGMEYSLLNTLALRAGWQKDLYTSEDMILSFGLGLSRSLPRLDRVRVNYAFVDHPTSLNTSQFSAGLAFDLFPELIKIERIEVEETYASLYKHHSRNPVGKAYVRYTGKKILRCNVEASTSTYSAPKGFRFSTELTPNDSLQTLPVQFVFDPSVMEVTQTTPIFSIFRILYLSDGRERDEVATARFTLHQRGTINWAEGVEPAAAFIDPSDETVNTMAHAILDKYRGSRDLTIPGDERLSQAMQIFKGLGELGIVYESDPVSPYASAFETKGLDRIYYPIQTLHRKRGDCDDTSILLAAFYEDLDIPTALVAVPGHLLIMFDTGILTNNKDGLLLHENMYHRFEGTYWIPVETTALTGRSFWEAWQQGKKRLASGIEDSVNVRQAWLTYEPTTLPQRDSVLVTLDAISSERALGQDADMVKMAMEDSLQKLVQEVAQHPEDLNLHKRLALKYARWPWKGERLEAAKTQYQKILASRTASDSFAVFNDLANIYLLQEQVNLDSAEVCYRRALRIARRLMSPDTFGVYLNLGALQLVSDEDARAIATYSVVVRDSKFIPQAESYLGYKLSEDTTSVRAADSKPKRRGVTKKDNRRAIVSKQPRSRGELLDPGWEIEDVFYWAILHNSKK